MASGNPQHQHLHCWGRKTYEQHSDDIGLLQKATINFKISPTV